MMALPENDQQTFQLQTLLQYLHYTALWPIARASANSALLKVKTSGGEEKLLMLSFTVGFMGKYLEPDFFS